jgi:hypothetical protein
MKYHISLHLLKNRLVLPVRVQSLRCTTLRTRLPRSSSRNDSKRGWIYKTYNLLVHTPVVLCPRAAEFLGNHVEGFVEVVLASGAGGVVALVVHFRELVVRACVEGLELVLVVKFALLY